MRMKWGINRERRGEERRKRDVFRCDATTRPTIGQSLIVEREQRRKVCFVAQKFASFESLHAEFDEEIDVDLLHAEGFDEINGRFHRTARGEQIVVDEHDVVG